MAKKQAKPQFHEAVQKNSILSRTPEEQAALDALEYVYLDVNHNLWVAPEDFSDGTHPQGFTTDPGLAKRFLRPEAMAQLIESCNTNSDYRVPVRVLDIVACSLGLEE